MRYPSASVCGAASPASGGSGVRLRRAAAMVFAAARMSVIGVPPLARFQFVASSFETALSLSSGAHSRDPLAPPQDEVLNPHGEERGNAARLEPRGHGFAIMIRPDLKSSR